MDPVTTLDAVSNIPDPETVRKQLADAVRRADLLRSLLRVSRRKAAYDQRPADQPEVQHAD